MRKVFCMAIVSVLVFCVGVSVGSAALKSEYKMSVNVTENTPWGQGAAMFARLVKERTDGRVNIKPYWSAQLLAGKQNNELFMLRNGTIDFSLAGIANFSTQVEACNLFNLPFFVSSQPDKFAAFDAVKFGKAGKILEGILLERGVRILGWGESGFRELHYGGSKPIKTPEDLSGKKIRFVSTTLYNDIFQALGANPISIGWNEAITAYQQGLVDGGENSVTSVLIPYKVYEFHKFITEWGFAAGALCFVAGEKTWESFDEPTQAIIRECATEAGLFETALIRMGMDNGWAYNYLKEKNLLPEDQVNFPHEPYEFLRSKGVEIVMLSPEEIAKFKEKTNPVFEKWIPKIGTELVKAAEEDMAGVLKK